MRKPLVLAFAMVAGAGCHCGTPVQNIPPQLGVSPSNLDFGFVKVGSSADAGLNLSAQTQASVVVSNMVLTDGTAGGAAAFTVLSPSATTVPGGGTLPVQIRFTPPATQQYQAILTLTSNDPRQGTTQVSLSGQGANPQLSLIPGCPQNCQGSATVSPPALDFGLQPLTRQVPIPVIELPTLQVSNTGNVPLTVTTFDIEGADAAAFSFVSNPLLPLVLGPGSGQTASIRFNPTSATQTSYSAKVVAVSDDPVNSPATVALTGRLRPHLPPVVCANLTHVVPSDGSAPLDYSSPQIWATLIPAPPTGYDFTLTRNVEPRSVVSFSALSNPNDPTTCTTDPDDQRVGLMYQWSVISQPAGSVAAVGGATTALPTMTPVATGSYTVQLTVTDAEGAATSTTLTFLAVLKKDLVVQLAWNTPDGGYPGVDLDLHLIRPSSTDAGDLFSGGFSYFNEPQTGMTSGDINGKSKQALAGNPGFNFDWGLPGTADDPSLDTDDTGFGALIENISLNYPEDDPLCATSSCNYKVMVHYFQDHRIAGSPPQCTVTGACFDGDTCNCADPTTACVANAADAGQSATGPGLCYVAPQPVVRVYVKAEATPRAVIPLDTLIPPNPILVGSPCEMWYVADVVWPSKAFIADAGPFLDGGFPAQIVVQGADAGRIVAPAFSRFGLREPGGLQCAPDITEGSSQVANWYTQEPR